uniref:Uncharacterized protein n=1 Tax=viral metagenome TaxID=1070528 RepID=A0A6C0IXL4_9ZZZZ
MEKLIINRDFNQTLKKIYIYIYIYIMNQNGGRVTMPSEYYGVNSGRYTPENGVNMGIDSAYGKTYPTSHGALIGDNLMGPDLGPYPNHSNTQTGGRPCTRRCREENCCSLSELNERMCTRNCEKKNCCSIKQNGGRVTMPSEYYGVNSGRYTPENGVNMGMDSAYGKTYPTSHGALIGDNLMGPDLGPYPNHSNTQTGGGYNKIVNPVTGRKVNVNSKLGKQIINNYLEQL